MISVADYEFFRGFLRDKSGLALPDGKDYLLESRLMPLARNAGMRTLDQLVEKLRQPGNDNMRKAVVDAMTTNESLFFRDKLPFDAFVSSVLPNLHAARPPGRPLRIWSAAASTGQEPFSLAMLVRENLAKVPGRSIEIVATDLSSEALDRARKGTFSQFEVQRGLPVQYLMKYFAKVGDNWQISDEILRMVKFNEFNLLDPLAPLGVFDVIFCRNVLIYFDLPTKVTVLDRLSHALTPDGFLVLGGAETVVGITERFRPAQHHRALYVRA